MCLKYIKFSVQNFGNDIKKINTGVDRLLLVTKLKKSSVLAKYIGNFVFIAKTKSSLFTPVFIFTTIFQILKTKFNVLDL